MSISIKTKEEIQIIREGGAILSSILAKLAELVRPGISTFALDQRAEMLIREAGGLPAFKGYTGTEAFEGHDGGKPRPFPATICTSVNDEVVHGIPSDSVILKEGDIVGIDIGMQWPSEEYKHTHAEYKNTRGLFTDMAVTVGVGKISSEAERLLKRTKEALTIGIHAARSGARVGDIGFAIEEFLNSEKLGIIRDLAGHGVGYALHEDPLIPNYGKQGAGPLLKEGMVIAIEPMATLGDWNIHLLPDDWTFVTDDKSLAAHFEHTIAVTSQGGEILTIPTF